MRIVTFRGNGVVQHGVRTGDTITVHPDDVSAVDLAVVVVTFLVFSLVFSVMFAF